VPNIIITDLGAAFTGSVFWDFCQDNTIDVYYSSVATPSATAKSNKPTPWCFKLLRTVSTTTPPTTPPGG
jgi:hypothetical protein